MSAPDQGLADAGAEGRPIGLLGGTFDPVHNGHLRVALEAAEALGLDEVRLIPLNAPGHRAAPLASTTARLAMLRAAVRAPLMVDDVEIARGGVSYTVDTLETLRARWPHRPLCLIIGRDAYLGLPSWKRPADLLRLAHLVVAARPDSGAAPSAALDELTANAQADHVTALHQARAGRVYFLDIPLLPIASSDLRARLAASRSIRHLVPDAVDDYIAEQRLYRP
ncbi:MAG: nicotinate-nucleotide adenylyltransferase [Gammaproteobacteria bacterium]